MSDQARISNLLEWEMRDGRELDEVVVEPRLAQFIQCKVQDELAGNGELSRISDDASCLACPLLGGIGALLTKKRPDRDFRETIEHQELKPCPPRGQEQSTSPRRDVGPIALRDRTGKKERARPIEMTDHELDRTRPSGRKAVRGN